MRKLVKCNKEDYPILLGIWERSVRATHDFLEENAMADIKKSMIPDYFPNVELYAVSDNGLLVGFIGLREEKIEMLFVDSGYRGRGYGSMLIEFARQRGVTKVDVNEQNPSAIAFYLDRGFNVTGRDETDEAGRPYPILHLYCRNV
ncbi:MAG: GNAT family N-acetyltransferase [Paramuribaculum sp.]|nr:GNAT family N-acetyltransferase [Paramuribaculum sp.]MDE6488152.1 GNAT family N-acetyltransferase [Paramuribaculum sp.]